MNTVPNENVTARAERLLSEHRQADAHNMELNRLEKELKDAQSSGNQAKIDSLIGKVAANKAVTAQKVAAKAQSPQAPEYVQDGPYKGPYPDRRVYPD